MRKKLQLTILILLLIIFASVGVFLYISNRPIKLSEESYSRGDIISVPIAEVETLANDKKSFLVFISQPECRTADDFEKVINELISQTRLLIYKTDFMYLRDTELAPEVRHYPSLLVFRDGKLLAFLDPSSDADTAAFKNPADLKSWLSKYIVMQ